MTPRDPRGAKPHPVRTASPVLREMFELADLYGVSMSGLSDHTGYPTQSIGNWRAGKNAPNIMAAEAIADALGYRLELVKK